MSNPNQLPLHVPLRALSNPVCRSPMQVVELPVKIIPAGHDECWQAFLHTCSTGEPMVYLACHGVSKGVDISVSFIHTAVLEERGFPFFGAFAKPTPRSCSPDDALRLLRAVVKAVPATAGEFRLGWVPDDPRVPF